MASQGPSLPGTGANDNSAGTTAWNNPGNITASDDTYAQLNGNVGNVNSQYLKGTGFGFSIPTGATIDGIVLDIERRQNSADNKVKDTRVRLVRAGTVESTDKADTSTFWPNTDTVATYGGSTDLWGASWSASDINDSGFGAAMTCTITGPSAGAARVDSYTITVYYTPAAGGAFQPARAMNTNKVVSCGVM